MGRSGKMQGDWVLRAEAATMKYSSAHFDDPSVSRSVTTVVLTSSGLSSHTTCFLEYCKAELCDRVSMWGIDGLLFKCLSRDDESYSLMVHALESVASLPFATITTLCIADADLLMLGPRAFAALCRLISSSPCLTRLYIYLPVLSPEDTHFLREAILGHCCISSLQSLSIGANIFSEPYLIPFLTSTMAWCIKSLSISFDRSYWCPKLIESICLNLIHNNLSNLLSFSLICSPTIYPLDMDIDFNYMLGSMLVHNTSLTSFTIYNAKLSQAAIRGLFNSLKENHHLTFLSLANCSCSGVKIDWPIASILDCLQVNTTLCKLNFTGTLLEYDNAITAQLVRNKRNAERVKVLRSSRSTLVRPTTVRLFLCGLPYSGKTTLSRSLANWNQNASWFSRARSTRRPKRTRGIDVTILEKEEGDQCQRILLWDMAGQTEFHSFHDSMFPDFSSRATPSTFLFVWNPFEVDTKGNIQLDSEGQKRKKFTDEFKYWLRFIASKTMKSEDFKPKVLVAITRADIGFDDRRSWLKRDFTALQEEFQEIIQFNEEGFFSLNAKDHLQVGQLGSHVFDCAKAILKQLPDVYKACAEAREVLGNMVLDNQIPCLITKEKFHQLCLEELHMDSQEMCEVVALSLNDSGDLIYFKSLELVVLDTQWFCHKIMGDLLNDIMTKESFIGDVFIPMDVLEALLERIVNSRAAGISNLINRRVQDKKFESMKVAGHDLLKLLVGLQLACLEDIDQNNSRIFLSVGLSGKAKRTIFPSNCLDNDGKGISTYLGRRLSCKNSKHTFLTPWLFPLLQVTFHKLLHDQETPVHVRLEEDVMAFALDGVKVLMEFCRLEGKDHFIDILVCSSKSLDDTIEWLQENVILEVEKVCREPRGIQGVELAHAIIQPACIQNFLEASRRPAVLVRKLQEKLKKEVEKKGVNDGIKAAQNTWQTGSSPADSVVDLLGKVETANVIRTYLCGLRDAESEISHLFLEKVETSQPEKPQFSTSQSSKEREIIYNKVCEVQQNVIIEFKDLGHSVQGLRNEVLPRLSELFTFVNEGEVGKFPRIPIVTEDDGIVQRVVSAIVPGLHNIRLQLLCECRSEPQHFVNGKRGLSLATLDDGLLKRGLPYINALLKLGYVAAKVGAHVAIGFGNSIPDFTKVLANIVDANTFDGFPDLTNDLTNDWNSSSRVDFKKGQQWLFDVLSNRDCIKGDQIYAIFGLRRVRLPDSRAAWVCDKHYEEGTPWPA